MRHKYQPFNYFIITFILTWTFWLTAVGVSYQTENSGLYVIFMLIGLMIPFLVSLRQILDSKDLELKKDFKNRLFNFRLIQPKFLLLSLLLVPTSIVISTFLSLFFGGSINQLSFAGGFSFSIGAAPTLFVLLIVAGFEELGWRGYAFSSLESKFSFLKSALLFGFLWALWHFPLTFIKDSYQYNVFHENVWFAVNFFISIIPMGVIVCWIYKQNNRSIIAAIIFHFMVNISQEALNITQSTKCIETALLIAFALMILIYEKRINGKQII